MPQIRVLDKSVSELIAAGEVIERPSSVIKEIVENSIDSGARRITVEIKNGGISYMRVTDDGCGMAYDDVSTAFLRHATSKLSNADDLESIETMGFRGEALASVAAVSRVEILTKQKGDELGTHYKIEGSRETEHAKNGCPDGTTIIIRDLFFNTPARLKFMKKDVSEGNFVQSVIDKLALSHPHISFRFIRDNKQVRLTTGDGKYYSAIYSVFGKQFAASLAPVDFSMGAIKICGFVSTPYFCRANRAMQYFFVNSRSIRNTTCTAALEEGYRNCVMTGKFPACVLNIEMPPQEVDVNVSPSKTDVKFANERAIFEAVYLAVKNAILNAENEREIELPAVKEKTQENPSQSLITTVAESAREKTAEPFVREERSSFAEEKAEFASEPSLSLRATLNANIPVYKPTPPEVLYRQERLEKEEKPVQELDVYKYINKDSFENRNSERQRCEIAPIIEEKEQDDSLRVIGELFKTYIVCENGDRMILIDKHAAHERIRFEDLKKVFTKHAQLLEEPERVTLSAEEWTAAQDFSDELSDMGMDVVFREDFRAEIMSVPTILEGASPSDVLCRAVALFMKGNRNATGEIFDDILHTFACKSAIKAHDNTSFYELEALAKRVWEDNAIRYCPHGRPIITEITKATLEKSFKRIV